jgi:hypothetical protein
LFEKEKIKVNIIPMQDLSKLLSLTSKNLNQSKKKKIPRFQSSSNLNFGAAGQPSIIIKLGVFVCRVLSILVKPVI